MTSFDQPLSSDSTAIAIYLRVSVAIDDLICVHICLVAVLGEDANPGVDHGPRGHRVACATCSLCMHMNHGQTFVKQRQHCDTWVKPGPPLGPWPRNA